MLSDLSGFILGLNLLSAFAGIFVTFQNDRQADGFILGLLFGPSVTCPTCREQIPFTGSAKFIDCPNCGQRVKS